MKRPKKATSKAKKTKGKAKAPTRAAGVNASDESLAASKISLAESEVIRDQATGRPRRIRGEFPLPSAGARSKAAGDKAQEPIRDFLKANADAFGLKADEQSLQVTKDVSTPTRHIVHFQQLHEGIPVVDSSVVVQVDKADRVKQIDLGHARPMVADEAADSGSKKMTPKQGQKAAMAVVGDANLRQDVGDPELVYYPTDAGLKLAYKVLIPTRNPPHDWRIIVDASSGGILEQKDLLFNIDGQGFVFDPNPVVTANNNTFRDPTATAGSCGFGGTPIATIDAQRVTRTLKDITFGGGVHKLEGPFVKMRNFGPPNIAPPTEVSANNFKYSSGDDRFENVMVYHHIDSVQRYIQSSLGITTAHNSQISADAHDGAGGGGFFSPVDLGIHFGDSGPCKPDRGEDADSMVHEYGHAIQNNQVPGWGVTNPGTGRAETRAMGEGFGDILACCYFAERGGGFQREVFEDWCFADEPTHALRRVDGTKVYPTDWHGEEHDDGEIWSAALWNIYRTIGGDSLSAATRQAAANALLKTLILSHHSVAANGSMPDGAEALMDTNAELDDFRGKHLIQMLNSFHARGLLRSPASGVDLWIRDAVGDPGVNAFTGPTFWNSPDLWIRNADDNGTTHQEPESGQNNFFYARVRNRGTQTARAFVVTFNVKPWAGTEFVYPGDWIPYISATVGYNLAPGASVVVKAKWPKALVPPTGTHACWLASVYTPVDTVPAGRHTWEHNNLAQKNMTVVNLIPGDSIKMSFQVGSQFLLRPERFSLEVLRPQKWLKTPVSIIATDPRPFKVSPDVGDESAGPPSVPVDLTPVIRFLEPTRVEITQPGSNAGPVRLNLGKGSTLDLGSASGEPESGGEVEFDDAPRGTDVTTDATGAITIAFKPGISTGIPITLQPRTPVQLTLKVSAPAEARPGDVIDLHVVQRNSKKQIVGGVTVRVNVVKK